MKTRRIKTKKTLVESKTVTDIKLQFIGYGFPTVFTETTPDVERNKIKTNELNVRHIR